MKKYLPWLAAAIFAAATVATNVPSSDRGSSAARTVGAAVWAANHNNQGRLCSYFSQELRTTACAATDNWHVTGVRVNADGSVRYTIENPAAWTPVYLTVAEHADGKWRIERID